MTVEVDVKQRADLTHLERLEAVDLAREARGVGVEHARADAVLREQVHQEDRLRHVGGGEDAFQAG